MTTLDALLSRLRRLLVLTAILVLLGAGTATAYWTARAQVTEAASAAHVGLEQTLSTRDGGSSLATTYSTDALTAAGTVTLENTGSREGTYSLAISPAEASDATLAAALRISAAPHTDGAGCVAGSAESGGPTGVLPFAATGQLDAGESIELCVQTSLAARDLPRFAGEELSLQIDSTLTYAEADAWRVEAPTEHVTQRVEADQRPSVEEMTPGTNGEPHYLELSFSPYSGTANPNAVKYRVFLAHEDTPEVRVPYSGGALSGYYPTVQISNTSTDFRDFVESDEGGLGNTWVYVEHRPPSEDWSVVAVGKIHTVQEQWWVGAYYGWQE